MKKPEISRYAFAMFDVLGFSSWITTVGLQSVLDSYHQLIEKVVIKPNEKGGLSAVQTSEGAVFALTGPPSYAYFSDTILLWHPLVPAFVDDFVTRCSELICEALAMNIPLRGAITLGDAVLDTESNFFLGKPIVEAAKLEKAQNWIGLTFGNSAVWSAFLAQLHGTTIIEYPPPTKDTLKEYASPIVVDWPRRWRDRHGKCPSSKLRELNKDLKFSCYWENTIKFAEFSQARHDWHLRPEEIAPDAVLRLVSRKEARL
ncbi:MAG TPA: hypothetical protein VIK35_08540 [Verrucomicrobiae bacterium]